MNRLDFSSRFADAVADLKTRATISQSSAEAACIQARLPCRGFTVSEEIWKAVLAAAQDESKIENAAERAFLSQSWAHKAKTTIKRLKIPLITTAITVGVVIGIVSNLPG
jgi:hypothetical protein